MPMDETDITKTYAICSSLDKIYEKLNKKFNFVKTRL